MTNLIQNITATGAWQEVPNIPHESVAFSIQAVGGNTVSYRYVNQIAYWTVGANAVRTVTGRFFPGNLSINATAGVEVQIEWSTGGLMA